MNTDKSIPLPSIEEVAYHASVHPELEFFFSFGRLHISRSPTIRLPVMGTNSGKHHSVRTEIADWQPSNLEVI